MRLNTLFSLGSRDGETRSARIRHRIAAAAAVLISVVMVAVAVPTAAVAATGDSTITVNAASLRTGSTAVAGLGGVRFGLFTATSGSPDSPGGKVTDSWGECATDENGTCTFTVPKTGSGQANRDARFWVKQLSAPAGHYLNDSLVTGKNTSSGSLRFAQTPLVFRTPALRSSNVTLPSGASMPSSSRLGDPINGDGSTADRWISGSAFAVSRDNNRYQPTCTSAARVAVVLDLSLSMNDGGLAGAKNAAKAFVASLAGTGTQVALFTFSTDAPAASGNNGKNWPAETVTSSNLQTFNTRIDAYGTHGYTNWDRGMWQVANESGTYDLAVVLTDGNPTVYGSAGTSEWTNLQKVQEAVYSANALKKEGTQVFAFGVGSGVSGPPDNLIAVSGPTEWNGQSSTVATSDYFRTSDWSTVASGLTSLAKSVTCSATIEVEKTERLADGTQQPGKDWSFTAEKVSGNGTLSTPYTTKTSAQGKAEWSLAFTGRTQTGSVTLTEDLAGKSGGWTFAGVVCTNKGVEFTVPQTLPIRLTGLGVGDYVKCSVVNQLPRAASITVDKKWVVNGAAAVANGKQPSGLNAQLTLDGTNAGWSTVHSGYASGSTVSIGETSTDTNELCSIVDQKITSPATRDLPYGAVLAVGANSFTITNHVTCDARLTLIKEVTGNAENGGSAEATDWTLTATAAGHPGISAGKSGTSSATAIVTPGVAYALAETGGPGGYQQVSVMCRTGDTGDWKPATNKTVTVTALSDTYCMFTNAAVAPQLKLTKEVTGDVVAADNWTLTAKDRNGAGNSGNGTADYKTVRAATAYTLGETPVSGFQHGSEFSASDWTCEVTDGPGAGDALAVTSDSTVTLLLGQKVECTIVNTLKSVVPGFQKDAGTAVSNGDGTWNVSYLLTVANPSELQAVGYSLSDTPDLPAGVTGVSAAVSLTGNPVTIAPWTSGAIQIADGSLLAAGAGPAVYTVTLTVRVASSVPAAALVCGPGGTGLDNSATMTPVVGQPITDDACVTIPLPKVTHTKTVASASQNADGSWTVVYAVTVTATGTGTALYDLSDTPKLGTGITLVSASAIDPAGTPVAAWNGKENRILASAMPIAVGTSQTYTVTVTASVAEGVVGTSAADCTLGAGESGTGFLNAAVLTAAGTAGEKTACATPATPEFDKSFTAAVQNSNGSWNVSYVLTATNTSSSPLHYSLSDAPGFASGITISGRTVTLSSVTPTVSIPWNGTAPIVTDRPLAANSHESFTVVFTVAVLPGLTRTELDCADPATAGHGFFNAATLTSGAESVTDTACGSVEEAVLPTILKTVKDGFPKQVAGGGWVVEYDVAVSTPSSNELAAIYDLSDALRFGTGFAVQSAAIAGPAGVTIDPSWTGLPGNTTVAKKVLLPAGTTHHYTVTVSALLAAAAATGTSAQCAADNVSNGGFLNTVRLTSGDLHQDASACAPPAVPTFGKVLDGEPTIDSIGQWTVSYLLTATNDSALQLNYDLSDALGLPSGFDITAASVTGPGANAGWNGTSDRVVVEDRVLAADSADVFEVVVTAAVTTKASIDDVRCTAEPGHGFFNSALLTSGAEKLPGVACADAPLASLTLVKQVDDSAFDGVDSTGYEFGTDQDWVLTATGEHAIPTGKTGGESVTSVLVPAGEYRLSEAVDPVSTNDTLRLYKAGKWTCGNDTGSTVTLGVGDEVSCTIVNTITPLDLPTLSFDPPGLASTGATVIGGLLTGLALLGVGLILLPFRQRRRVPRHLL